VFRGVDGRGWDLVVIRDGLSWDILIVLRSLNLLSVNNFVIVSFRELPLIDELLVSKGVSDLIEGNWVNSVDELLLVELVVWLDPSVVLGSDLWLLNWLNIIGLWLLGWGNGVHDWLLGWGNGVDDWLLDWSNGVIENWSVVVNWDVVGVVLCVHVRFIIFMDLRLLSDGFYSIC
jgi:hypothetical protein